MRVTHLKHTGKSDDARAEPDADWKLMASQATLCWQYFLTQAKWTEDPARVTCKRCLKMMRCKS